MGHWLVRWFLFTWAIHFAAQTTFISCVAWYFGYSDQLSKFLAAHRPLAAFILVVHLIMYLLTELLSVDRDRLDEIEHERLKDE